MLCVRTFSWFRTREQFLTTNSLWLIFFCGLILYKDLKQMCLYLKKKYFCSVPMNIMFISFIHNTSQTCNFLESQNVSTELINFHLLITNVIWPPNYLLPITPSSQVLHWIVTNFRLNCGPTKYVCSSPYTHTLGCELTWKLSHCKCN